MDDKEREQFKGMFTVNVIYLNILIFAIALAVALGIIAPNTWEPKIPIVVGSIIVAVVTLILFIENFKDDNIEKIKDSNETVRFEQKIEMVVKIVKKNLTIACI